MTWQMVPLGELGVWTGGGTPSKSRSDYWGGDIPWLSPKDMGTLTLSDTQDHISPTAVAESSTKLVPAGSIAIVTRSGILEHTLPSAYIPFDVTLNQDMKALTPRPGLDPKWVLYGLRAFERQILSTCRKAGTTVASIEWRRFANFQLPVASLNEQRRIVELVEEHLSHLDAADASIGQAKHRVSSLIDNVLTTWRERNTTVMTPLGAIASTQLGKMLDAKKASGQPVPYLANINVRWGEFDLRDLRTVLLTEPEREKFSLQRGDLLLCEGGEPGRGAVWKREVSNIAFQKALHRVRVSAPDRWRPEYVAAMIREGIRRHRWDHLFTGTTIKHLPQEKLRLLEIPEVSLEQQDVLLNKVDGLEAHVAQLQQSVTMNQQRSAVLRRAVLAAAFSGRLTDSSSDTEVIEETAADLAPHGSEELQ